MKSSHLRLALAIACAAIIVIIPATAQNQKGQTKQAVAEQAKAATAKGQTAGEYFKNVTTPTLKGLTPSDFLGAMGVMTAAVGFDCSNCHPGAGTDKFDFVSDALPVKRTARRMVEMVTAINKTHFGGVQMVTCWTCHHQQDIPTTSIQLDRLYDAPAEEKRDMRLKLALDSDVRLVRFEPGRIEFELAPGGARDLASTLTQKLQLWTNERWMVSIVAAGGAPTLKEQRTEKEQARRSSLEADPMVAEIGRAHV